MESRSTIWDRPARGIAAAAICAGLALAPRPALAEGTASSAPAEGAAAAQAAASDPTTDSLAQAQRDQVSAQDQVTQAQNDVSEATAAKNAADQSVAADRKAQSSAQTEVDVAQKEADAAQEARDEAKEANDQAEKDAAKSGDAQQLKEAADEAKAGLDAAQKAQAQAQSDADQKQQAAEAAKAQEATAATDLANRQRDEKAAQSAYESASKEASAAASELNQAKGSKDAADSALASAKSDLDKKQAAYDSADAAYQSAASAAANADQKVSEAQAAEDAAKSDLDKKQAVYDAAKSNLTAAQSEKAAADKAYKAASAEKTAADKAVADAQKAVDGYAKGSYGYFQKRGDTQALTVFNDASVLGTDKSGAAFNSYTTLGGASDATSLENMKKALDLIKECNDIRTGKGASGVSDGVDSNFGAVSALKVSSFLMAVAQANANWLANSGVWGHAANQGETWRYGGENIAWTYQDPFVGWYKKEKENYDTKNGKETGHYTNIMSASFAMTGVAANGRYYVQDFDYANAYYSKATAVDFASYYNDFMSYYNGKAAADKALADAKARASKASSALISAGTRKSNAASALTQATTTYNSAKSALDAAKSKEAQTSSALASAKAAARPYDEAKEEAATKRAAASSALSTAKTTYQTASTRAKNANEAYQRASQRKSGADSALRTASSNLASAKQATKAAQSTYDAAHARSTAASQASTNAQAALKAANADVANKQKAYDAAKKAYEDATVPLQRAKEAYEAAQVTWKRANGKLETAQKRLGAASSSYKLSVADADAAARALSAAQVRLRAAQSGLSSADARLAAAQAAWDRAHAQAVQEMYRCYNPNSGEHFYTASAGERDHIVSVGWRYEGVGWTAPKSSSTPVYRLYNPNAGDHHYTMSVAERDNLIRVGWSYEGIGWYSDDARGVPLYRQYNPNARAGSHNYTTSRAESDHLVSVGWNYEGVAWYGVDPKATSGFRPKAPTASVALRAHWAVRYDGNGGEGHTAATVAEAGKAAALSANSFSRDGYSFAGWAASASGPAAYADGSRVSGPSGDGSVLSLFAVWAPIAKTYAVTYDGNGATGGQTASQTMPRDEYSPLARNGYLKEGYAFVDWGASKTGAGDHYSQGQYVDNLAPEGGSITLYAQWKPNDYTVYYMPGSTTGSVSTQSFTYDQEQRLYYGGFSRTGYKLAGWAMHEGGNKAYELGESVKNLTNIPNGPVYLYPYWEANTYYVQFVPGSTVSGSMGIQRFTYDQAQRLTANGYSRTGYKFVGWENPSAKETYSNGQYVSNLTSVDGDLVALRAKWSPITYTLKFDSNGGMNELAKVAMTYDKVTTLKKSPFVRIGYSFAGWSTGQDGSGRRFADGATVSNLASVDGAGVTLYAQWTQLEEGRDLADGDYLLRPSNWSVEALGVKGGNSGLPVVTCEYFAYQDADVSPTSVDALKQTWSIKWDSAAGGYEIRNLYSDKVLAVAWSDKDGAPVIAASHAVGTNPYQRWRAYQEPWGYDLTGKTYILYHFINCGSGLALQISSGGDYEIGAKVEQSEFEYGPGQSFTLTPMEELGSKVDLQEGTYSILLSDDPSACLEFQYIPSEYEGCARVANYTGSASQKWKLVKTADGAYAIESQHLIEDRIYSMTDPWGNASTGTALSMEESSVSVGTAKWFVLRNSDGTYTLQNTLSRLVVSTPCGANRCVLLPNSTGSNVRFRLVKA